MIMHQLRPRRSSVWQKRVSVPFAPMAVPVSYPCRTRVVGVLSAHAAPVAMAVAAAIVLAAQDTEAKTVATFDARLREVVEERGVSALPLPGL